jgi:ribonucrease Y
MEPVLIALALVGGACAGVLVEHMRRRGRIGDATREAERILEDARRQGDAQVKEARVTAREELLAQRTEQERDLAERRAEIIKIEERLASNQSQLESAIEELARREQSLSDREVQAKQPPRCATRS